MVKILYDLNVKYKSFYECPYNEIDYNKDITIKDIVKISQMACPVCVNLEYLNKKQKLIICKRVNKWA